MSLRQPNILLVMADQLMPFLTGAYGHRVVKTPNLNRLVQNGIRFDAAYTPCPLCAPARAAFMSGQYGSRIGCYDNANVLPDDNTIILFASDHGDMLAEKKMIQKRCFYEWSARIPIIISFPDGYQAGRKVEQPVSLIDIVPTILDLAGIAQEARAPMDAQSLSGLIDGSDRRDRVTFSEFHTDKVKEPCFMVRQGKYKYVHIHNHPGQLFDLEADPGEWDNLSGRADVAKVESALRNLILEQFDPDTIKEDALASVRKREIVREAMEHNDTHWDYFPYFDATRQYAR